VAMRSGDIPSPHRSGRVPRPRRTRWPSSTAVGDARRRRIRSACRAVVTLAWSPRRPIATGGSTVLHVHPPKLDMESPSSSWMPSNRASVGDAEQGRRHDAAPRL
jgi:hypothetical protein